jgi:hypothetical protein
MIEDVEKLSEEVNKLEKRIKRDQKKLSEISTHLKVICPHNERDVKEDYIPGSYLDKEQFLKITYCKICGVELEKDITYGFYG